jgi:PAS domain S-box-containing protein
VRPERFQSIGWRLALAFGSSGMALIATLSLRQWVGVPFWFLFLVAVIGSAWIGGRVAGWAAVILSTLAVDFFFTRPAYSLYIEPEDLPYFIVFTGSMIVGNWFGNWRRSSDVSVRREMGALEQRVEQEQQERRRAELRWQAVFDNSLVGIALADEQGRIIAANQRFGELLRLGLDQLAGLALDQSLAPAAPQELQQALAELLQGGRGRADLELQRHGRNGEPVWLRTHITLLPGTPDFPRFVTVFCEEISDRKRAEEALLSTRAELARATRFTMIGELTASIAHEVNQPLAAIVTNGNACLRWLAAEPPNLAEVRNTVSWVMRDARRASDVIARVRAMMQKAEPRLAPVNFNDIVLESLDLIKNDLVQDRVQVRTELDPALPTVPGERIQLQQVFLNLVLNAVEALATLSDRPRQLQVRTAPRGDAEGIAVEVRDNGPGVPAADLEKLFGAFFTTKDKGTGLGLWISRSIIENHAGQLQARLNQDSGEGPGISFRILLPGQVT